jgi:hypothetical protein
MGRNYFANCSNSFGKRLSQLLEITPKLAEAAPCIPGAQASTNRRFITFYGRLVKREALSAGILPVIFSGG